MRLSGEPDPLLCPVCGAPLAQRDGVLVCPAGHSFDIAREGYVNLLAPAQARRAILGDEKAMLLARRRFLEAGHYAPLMAAINETVIRHVEAAHLHIAYIVDAGCGEGAYLGALQAALEPRKGEYVFTGIDIAKDAARLAARRYPGIRFVVADITGRLPLPDASADVLLNVFAPRNPAEFRRVLAPGGLLLVVIPAPGHLASLRERFDLLGVEEDKRAHVAAQFTGGFTLDAAAELGFSLALDAAALLDLVQMTPNYWHLAPETREALASAAPLETQAAFELLSFRRG